VAGPAGQTARQSKGLSLSRGLSALTDWPTEMKGKLKHAPPEQGDGLVVVDWGPAELFQGWDEGVIVGD
jgi:hypothetical protein